MLDQVIHGDALEVLKTLPDQSVDAIGTDSAIKRSQSRATLRTCGICDKDTLHYQSCLHRFLPQTSLQALCGVHLGLYAVVSSPSGNDDTYNHPLSERHALKLSNRVRSSRGILHAMMDYLRLYDKHYNNQENKNTIRSFSCAHHSGHQILYHNSSRLAYAMFSYLLACLKRLSLRLYLREYKHKALLRSALLRLYSARHSDTQESKRLTHALLYWHVKAISVLLYRMLHSGKVSFDSFLLQVMHKSIHGYKFFVYRVLIAQGRLDKPSHNLGMCVL